VQQRASRSQQPVQCIVGTSRREHSPAVVEVVPVVKLEAVPGQATAMRRYKGSERAQAHTECVMGIHRIR
jgi:hypothetical protein